MDSTRVPSLRLVSEQILRYNWAHVRDVGDCPYEVVANVLKLSTAEQLSEIEENSPHLAPHTNAIWKQLCVNDFLEVRKLVEDGKIEDSGTEEGSWKARYIEEEEKKQVKMKLVLEKLRGQYNELDEKKQSRQVQSIDGLRLEKRRKLMSGGSNTSTSRPKTLLQKARHNTKAISSIYAPKRRPAQLPPARQIPALATAFPSSRRPPPKPSLPLPIPPPAHPTELRQPDAERQSPSKASSTKLPFEFTTSKRPIIKTVTRITTKRSSSLNNATSPPPSSSSSRQTSFSPPPPLAATTRSFEVPPSRPISQLPLRARVPSLALSPPPTTSDSATIHPRPVSKPSLLPAQSSPPPPQNISTKPLPQRKPASAGLFIPKKK